MMPDRTVSPSDRPRSGGGAGGDGRADRRRRELVQVDLDRVATGGAAIGPGPDGRLVFVTGGLPGERVTAEVTLEHRSRREARGRHVEQPSPHRRPPPCPHVAAGCGGCDWQHVDDPGQRQLRRSIVVDCLRRLAGLDDAIVDAVVDAVVDTGPSLPSLRYRTTVRAAVTEGRAGFRAAGSHRVVPVDDCLVAHPRAAEILAEGWFGAATEVTVRVGERTGDRLVVVAPTAEGVRVPDDVAVVGTGELDAGADAHFHEEVAGRRFRIGARSFFQCRPDGAELLVDLVGEGLAGAGDGPLIDAYCGVGLFGVLLGDGRPVTGVELNRSSVADARVNLRRPSGEPPAAVVRSRLERWRPVPAAAVVADPARVGLKAAGADVVTATGAAVIALVSCDPASLARDARLLIERGYRLDRVTTVDLFGQTSHVETVSRFVPA